MLITGITEKSPNTSFLSETVDNLCVRCNRKVYNAERVETEIVIHQNCFKCGHCGCTLSLHTYVLATYGPHGMKDVFCKGHAPRAGSHTLPAEAMGIKNAVEAQKISKRESFNSQVGRKYLCTVFCILINWKLGPSIGKVSKDYQIFAFCGATSARTSLK